MSQRLTSIEVASATGKVKELFDATQAKIKMIPNLYRVIANSAKALEGYLSLNSALAQDSLPAKLHEQLAIALAEANQCDYCLSAHTTIGKIVGLDAAELAAAQSGQSADAKSQAALVFARQVVEARGQVSDAQIQAVKAAGYTDGQLVEIVSHVALNTLTNYMNNVAKTAIDFPVASFVTHKAA